MPISYDHVMRLTDSARFTYGDRETILYALGTGFGRDPMNTAELPFVYEGAGLVASPLMACVLQGGGAIVAGSGINFLMMVHGEQRVTLHAPLPPRGEIVSESRVSACVDKGEGKGAVIVYTSELKTGAGVHLATVQSSLFARGDGGFGGPREGAPAPHALPERAPDFVYESETREDQALLYRLCGDRNPLHADPGIASAAGFPRPILHGLCTFGTAGRMIVQHVCGYDAARLKAIDARFSSPVFPGETLIMDIWRDGDERSFRVRTKERGQIVLNNGRAVVSG